MAKLKEIRAFQFRVESTSDEGIFEGYASVFNTLIPGERIRTGIQERVMPGSFKKTLNENHGQVPVYWEHGDMPIGLGKDGREDHIGFKFAAELDINNNARAREGFGLLKMAETRQYRKMGLSIGFIPIKDSFKKENGVQTRYIHEVSLREVSICMFPAHPETWVTQVRSAQELTESVLALSEEEWALLKAARSGTSDTAAIQEALDEILPKLNPSLNYDEIQTALGTILESYGGN
jgi:HK97 family phage prohead protease